MSDRDFVKTSRGVGPRRAAPGGLFSYHESEVSVTGVGSNLMNIPVVEVPDTSGSGSVPGRNPTQFSARRVTVLTEYDPAVGPVPDFSFEVSGPNDPDVVAATALYSQSGLGPKEMATAIYREAARRQSARGATGSMSTHVTHERTTPAAKLSTVPVINDHHGPAASSPPPEPPGPPPAAPYPFSNPAAEMAKPPPRFAVEFLLGDGGVIEVEYEDVEISGDTLALVSSPEAARTGLYMPPKSDAAHLAPVHMRIQGLPDVIVAHRLQDAYVVGGRRHLVLMIDRP